MGRESRRGPTTTASMVQRTLCEESSHIQKVVEGQWPVILKSKALVFYCEAGYLPISH
jgi:hypothetical protein